MNFTKITALYAVVGAIVGLGGYAYAFGDSTGLRPWFKFEQDKFTQEQFKLVMDQTQLNSQLLAKGQLEIILGKGTFTELSFDDKVSVCKNAQILGYDITDDKGNVLCSKDTGEPVLIVK